MDAVEDGNAASEEGTSTYAVRALHTSLRQHRSYAVARFADPPPDWTRCEGHLHVRKEEDGTRALACGPIPSVRRMRGVPERVGGGTSVHYALVMQGDDVVALPLESWYTYRNAPVQEGDRPTALEEAERAMHARQHVRGNVHPKLRQHSEQQHAFSTSGTGGGLGWTQATDRDSEDASDRDQGGRDSEDEDRVPGTRAQPDPTDPTGKDNMKDTTDRMDESQDDGGTDVEGEEDRGSKRRSKRRAGTHVDEGEEEEEEEEEGEKEDWEFEENATDDEEEQKEEDKEEAPEEAPKDVQEAYKLHDHDLDESGRKLQEVIRKHNLSEGESVEAEDEDDDFDHLDEDADRRFGNAMETLVERSDQGKDVPPKIEPSAPQAGIKRPREETRQASIGTTKADAGAAPSDGSVPAAAQSKRPKPAAVSRTAFFEKEIVSLLRTKAPLDSKEFARHFTNHMQNAEDKKAFTGVVRRLVKLVEIPPGSGKKFMVLK